MSSDTKILEDSSKLSRLDRAFFKLESSLTLFSGIVIFSLISLSVVNVFGRWLFSLPISGYIDWIEQFMAFLAFLGIAYVQRLGSHIRMDMFIGKLKNRRLWCAELLSIILILGISLIIVYGSYLHFLRAFVLGDSSFDINLPTWPAKLVVPVAFVLLSIRLVLQAWACVRAIICNTPHPIALPIIQDAQNQAESEAKSLMREVS